MSIRCFFVFGDMEPVVCQKKANDITYFADSLPFSDLLSQIC